MRLLNGMVFGLGLGLLSASAVGLVGPYSETTYILGTLLLIAETGRLLYSSSSLKKQQDQI